MNKVNKPYQRWQLIILDKITGQTYDRKKYVVKDEDELQKVVDELFERFIKLGVTKETIEIEAKFIKFIKGMSA